MQVPVTHIASPSPTGLSANTSVCLPVIGASTSSMHFSWRRMLAPSLMILRATSSSTRPSLTRWLRSSSALGLPLSNSSFTVSLCCGGYGTAVRSKTRHLERVTRHRNFLGNRKCVKKKKKRQLAFRREKMRITRLRRLLTRDP